MTSRITWPIRFGLMVALLSGPLSARAAAPASTLLGSYSNGLSAPVRVLGDTKGLLLVAEPQEGRVVAFDVFGRKTADRTGFQSPLALGRTATGDYLVGEEGLGCVGIYDASWQRIGKLGGGDGEFLLPNFIATDPTPGSNTIFVSDSAAHRVKVYYSGTLAFSIGSLGTGPGQFDFPTGLLATSNELMVVDQNNDRVQVFNSSGAYLREFSLVTPSAPGSPTMTGGRSQGIARDAAGRVYVADGFQGIVRVFDPDGAHVASIGSFGEAPGQLGSPSGVEVDALGRLFVASPNNGRIECFGLDSYLHLAAVPPGGPVAAGTSVVFTASGPALGSMALQWRINGTNLVEGGHVSGATNADLILSGLDANDAGSYTLEISGAGGTNVWTSSPLSVLSPPSVLSGPTNRTVAAGTPVTFSVAATGDVLQFQWQHAGADIPDATNATWFLASAQASDTGEFAVVVSNAVGSIISAPAVLTVIEPPVILLHPADTRVIVGDTAMFDVSAAGNALSYAWRFNGSPLFAPALPAITLANVQAPAAGAYAVVVSNLAGVATSHVATLSVLVPPATQSVAAVEPQAGGSLLVRFAGEAGYRFTFDFSPDLTEWTSLTNAVFSSGTFDLLDADATNEPLRFYRMRWRP